MNAPFFSVVVCSIDQWKFTQVSKNFEHLLAGFPHEIIGIHDARSLCEGYNRGLRRARGDIVIFSHDDVIFLDERFAEKIGERMQSWDLLGFAGASRLVYPAWFGASEHLHGAVCHWSRLYADRLQLMIYGAKDWPVTGGIEVMDGLCMIARREVAAAVGFDDDTFDGWHLYDCDFSFAAHLAGYKIGVCCDIPYIHASASVQSTDSSFTAADYQKYAKRFIRKYEQQRQISLDNLRSAPGTSCFVNDHMSLVKLWTEDVFRRATVAIDRRHVKETP
ncbi:MAG: glycosyltransferase family protein [Betaproteobacteria bacterium]|nr:glycosyltransferase family protein [Betaproteobacteria bacterium]MCL2887151.1 glycosyltransferase family protein [Betaproteobacteria bacterium]